MIPYVFLAIVIAKLIPHPPSITPLLALVYMAGVVQHARSSGPYDWLYMLMVIAISSVCGDAMLSHWYGYPAWGAWSWFSMVGLWGCMMLGRCEMQCLTSAYLSVGYWSFTNLGVFITSGLYPQNIQGLFSCYSLALPFLPGLYLSTTLTLILLTFLCFSPQKFIPSCFLAPAADGPRT